MSTTSNRSIVLIYSGDIASQEQFSALPNATSPGLFQYTNLNSGANTISVPTSGSAVPSAVTIIPPVSNSTSMIIKGVTGDTGIRIHSTDPTTIALDPSVSSFVITAGASITGLKLYWS